MRLVPVALPVGFTLIALAVFAPALHGSFLSDDLGYIVTNPYVHALSLDNLRALLDPWGEPALYTANWAPVHLLAHALEWSLWGPDTTGYHVVNVVLHALATALLVALLVRRGFPPLASGLAGLVFLVHPANVETVAWIFQLKTLACLALGVGALLAFPTRPLLAAVLFAAGLLSKASTSFALPVAAVFAWNARDPADGWRRHARWLLVWGGLFALYAAPALFSFGRQGMLAEGLHPDPWVHVRTAVAIGARYLVMAATSWGVAPFHEPPPALSWLDPWWLAGLALGGLLAARVVWALARRREEAAWWVWAAAAWAPVSQALPFLYPMADRYLYTILPGLLGAALCVAGDVRARFAPRAARPGALSPARVATAAVLVLAAVFAVRSHAQARIWRSEATLTLATVRHYPDGLAAQVVSASRAARRGDAAVAAGAARRAFERGFHRFMYFYEVPDFAAVREDPRFQAVLADMAGAWIEATRDRPRQTQADLRVRAHAHYVRGELEEAAALLEQALRLGGGFDEAVRAELAAVRARLAERDTTDGFAR